MTLALMEMCPGYIHMFFICTECMCLQTGICIYTHLSVYMSTFVHMLSNTGILFCACQLY